MIWLESWASPTASLSRCGNPCPPWVPWVPAGTVNDFQWGEFEITCVLTAGAWVVTDSYHGSPWLAVDMGVPAERGTAKAAA